ncbi:MAG TPA: GNAT family N-acetyltransferase [Acidimicrobiales bacterium]|nr:GNAT family N-acetyltransferase [Acidimicrobiales bacterium]
MRVEEADDVAALVVHANAENLAAFPPTIAAGYRDEIVRIAGRLSGAETYVADLDGEVVGTVSLVTDAGHDGHPWPPNGAVIRFLAVAPNHAGRQLGRRLTETCVDRARALGAAFVGLHTAPVMTAARRIYERAGFVRAPDHDFSPAAHYGDADPDDPPWGLAYVLRFD